MGATVNDRKNSSSPEETLRKWFTRLAILGLFISACRWLDGIKDRWYVFDPTSLHQLAQEAVAVSGNDTYGMIDHIVANLTATYPKSQIALNTNTKEWTLSNAGGAMGAMYVIHASITEYLIIFGTPLGTEGHTGIHTADDYFNILSGEQWAFSPPNLEMERYTPGMVHHLPRGHAKQYKMHKGCYALEYARGWIPLMLPFGLGDVLSSTLDVYTFFDTAKIMAREATRNLLVGKI